MSTQAKVLLNTVKNKSFSNQNLADKAIKLAVMLLDGAQAEQTRGERARGAKIAAMMDDPQGKALTMVLSDQAFRSHNPARIADQVSYLLEKYGVPRYFAWWEQLGLHIGGVVGKVLPRIVVPAIVARLRAETKYVILPGEEKPLQTYIHKRRQLGTRLNLNQLGEAILGEGEAKRRLKAYLDLLARPNVEYISVKISSVYSQINLVAFDETVKAIKEPLRTLYRAAQTNQYVPLNGKYAPFNSKYVPLNGNDIQSNGQTTPKFVNLDMEEYRDLHLTVAAFQQVLDEAEFQSLKVGIVLQAYLPDSAEVQQTLTKWARERVERGGAPIKIRIVKGANLAMEEVEAALSGWEQAPYANKTDVDANYKRMVHYGCQPENAPAAQLGIASHNLFDIAYAMLLRAQNGVERWVEFEMLEGMANQQARVIQDVAGGVLLYAPVVKNEDFHSAIAYLVRRLDENTAPQNFLHDLFGLQVGTPSWQKQKKMFLDAVERQDKASDQPRRQQNRITEHPCFTADEPFSNAPDTDWSLPANQAWIRAVVRR